MAEPLGHCVIHGDYWTEDCLRCHPPRPSMAEPERAEVATTPLPERTVEAAREVILNEVDNRLRSGRDAYGTSWAGEGTYTEFIVGDSPECALAAAMDPALGPDRLVVAGEHEREVETLRAAIDAALRTTWEEDEDGGWGDGEDTLYADRIEALAALQPHWLLWGDNGWHLAGCAEERERGLRGLIREMRQFIPHERPEQGPLPAWIVDITARADAALAGGEVGPPSEQKVRTDQTRRIVEWLRSSDHAIEARDTALGLGIPPEDALADAIEREFGGGDDGA